MKNVYVSACLIIGSLAIALFDIHSQTLTQIGVGARPLGLGEAYTSVADDGNAVYWNPAGLPNLKRMEFNTMYANPYAIQGLRNIYLSMVLPLTSRYYFGASWFHFGFNDDELEFFTNKVNISFAARVIGNLSLGSNLKYVNTDSRLDGLSEGKANGFGFDLGVLYSYSFGTAGLLKQINLGLMAHDMGGTRITYASTKKSETILPQNIRWGFSLLPKDEISLKWFSLKNTLLAFDFDDRIHMGAETWLVDALGLRGGFQKDLHTNEGITYSFGGSIKFPHTSLQLDYAYTVPPTLNPTHVFSFSFIPSLSPIKITDINVSDVYASLYLHYANTPIGSVVIRNDYDKELKISIKVTVPGYMETATQESFVLGPNREQSTSFYAVFTKNILNVRESEFPQAKVRVEYKIKNEEKFTESTKKFKLYGRGAITWDDPKKAAAFITKLDPSVDNFKTEATKDLSYRSELELGNLYTATTLHDAMGAWGIKYREDPVNPFSIIPKSQHSVDYVKYPSQVLLDKQGDCDDLTALYASLLESAGIRTALISTFNHITLMFDTGIHSQNWGVLPVGDSLAVVRDKTLWIPIEVTEIGNSFENAWKVGGRRYRESEHDEEFVVFNVRDAEGIYLSALPEEFQNQTFDLSDKIDLKLRMEGDFNFIQQKRSTIAVRDYLEKIHKEPFRFDLINELGIVYAQQDSLILAENQFAHILQSQPDNLSALNNLANVYCISGKFIEAEAYYTRAAKYFENNAGYHLNLAILYQLWKLENTIDSLGLQLKSDKNLEQAFKLLNGDTQKAYDLLGIFDDGLDIEQKADYKTWSKNQTAAIKKFIKDNSKKYLFNKSVKGAQIERRGVKRGLDNARSYILWWASNRSFQ